MTEAIEQAAGYPSRPTGPTSGLGDHIHGDHIHAVPGGYPAGGYVDGGYVHAGYGQGQVRLAVESDPFSRWVTRVWARSPVWTAPLAILVCFAGGVVYTLLDRPTEAGAFASPTCLVKLTTGFDCPGCGGTRAFWYLLHGNVPAAARSHIMAVFAAPFLVYMYIAWATNLVFNRKLPMFRPSTRTISIFLAAWGIFSVLRNLPWAPFTWLYV